MKRILLILWTGYLCLAPVYWLPGISINLLYAFKFILIASAVSLSFIYLLTIGKLTFPRGIIGLGGFILIIFVSMPALMQTDSALALKRIQDYFLGYSTFFAAFALSAAKISFNKPLFFSALFISVLCSLVTASAALGVPSFTSPSAFGSVDLAISGFSGLRTGWSIGTGLYLSALFFIIPPNRNFRWVLTILVVLCFFQIVGSQVAVGGRSGLVMSLAIISVYFWKYMPKSILLIIGLVFFLFVSTHIDYLAEHLRFDRISSSSNQTDALNHFSAGRIGTYIFAFEKFFESPLTGHGFGNVQIHGIDIHNLWLRMLAEGGLFLPLLFLLFIYKALKSSRFSVQKNDIAGRQLEYDRFILQLIIWSGILASLFEPNTLLGTFQNSCIWWVSLGCLLGPKMIYQTEKNKQEDAFINK